MTHSRHYPLASWQLECPTCGVNCIQAQCDHQVSFVADIPVETVTAAALQLWSAPEQQEGRCYNFASANGG